MILKIKLITMIKIYMYKPKISSLNLYVIILWVCASRAQVKVDDELKAESVHFIITVGQASYVGFGPNTRMNCEFY